jgi:hypothetical protein
MTERITRPGKFEGQMAYMELAYEQFLDGFYNQLSDGVISVEIKVNKVFKTVRFIIDDQGFVREV